MKLVRSSSRHILPHRAMRVLRGVGLLALASCGGSPSGPDGNTGPAMLRVVAGADTQDSVAGRPVVPLIVQATDGSGHPIVGARVEFTAERADTIRKPSPVRIAPSPEVYAGLLAVTDTTDSHGRATVFIMMSTTAGLGTIKASMPAEGLEAKVSTTTLPGRPVSITLAPRDTPIYAAASFPLRAHLTDRYSNVVPGLLTFSTTSNSISLSAAGVVQGASIGRARIMVQGSELTDSVAVSVVPRGVIGVLDHGRTVGDTLGFAQQELDGSDHRWIAITGQTPSSWSPSNEPAPKWVGSTGRLAYSVLDNGTTRLYVSDGTSTPLRLTDASFAGRAEMDPEVTSDGKWVYFVASDTLGIQAIWRVQSTGGAPEIVLNAPNMRSVRWPSLSPDATQIAFVSTSYPGSPLLPFVHDFTTDSTRQIGTTEAAGLRWSPTGEWILYTQSAQYAGYSGPLHLIHPDGTGDRILSRFPYLPGGAWTADGKYLLVVRAYDGLGGYAGTELLDMATGLELPLAYRSARSGATFKP